MPAKNGFVLQDRDIDLLNFTLQLGLVTLDHFARHTERTRHGIYKRVARLEEQRYLSRITKQPEKAIYQLGPQGALLLIEHGYAPESIASRRMRANELKPLGRAHALLITDIHAELLRETKNRPEKIALWRQDVGLRARVRSRDAGGRQTVFNVEPDAYFILERTDRPEGKNRSHYFVEADRSTMSNDRIAGKIRGYIAYHNQQQFLKTYPGMKSFRVAVITETRKRAESLRARLAYLLPTAPLQRAYQFMALEDMTLDALLPHQAALTP